jgi:hypothetical protein
LSYLNLPFIVLPKEFCQLLSDTLSETRKDYTHIVDCLCRDKATQLLLNKILESYRVSNLYDFLSIHGWTALRNNLASLYVAHIIFKKFPETPDLSLIQDLLDFEERYNWLSPKGQSRLFLFGFYLKISGINFQKSGEQHRLKEIQIPEGLDSLLKFTKTRSNEPDILLILTWFIFNINENIKFQNQKFHEIYNKISDDEKAKLLQNYLNYSGSIHNDEFLISARI